jgi:hypothetical protein
MSTELQTANSTITPLKSMRQVENTDQLQWVLEKALVVIKKRDEAYTYSVKYSDTIKEVKTQFENYKKYSSFGTFMLLFFTLGLVVGMFCGALALGLVQISTNINPYVAFLVVGVISAALSSVAILFRDKKAYKNKYDKALESVNQISGWIENNNKEFLKIEHLFWCAEIIPIEYRSQKAVEIMLSAIRKSRADNWKECCDIYDKECEREDMREYQAAQLALSQEAATNSKWAAAGAWATFGSVLFK